MPCPIWLQRTYQEEGACSGDLVELHQQPQGLLVVAAVLLIHTELVLLQDRGRAVEAGVEEDRH
jgi:hypothetical protein